MKTLCVKPEDANRVWYIIDAQGKRLGRIAAKVASMLRGKTKPTYTPNMETGDYVIVINADKITVSGRKYDNKMYYYHTGFPGGIKENTYRALVGRNPVYPLEIAIRGMLPKGPLGRKIYGNVKVYAGPDHPHAAQQPTAIEV